MIITKGLGVKQRLCTKGLGPGLISVERLVLISRILLELLAVSGPEELTGDSEIVKELEGVSSTVPSLSEESAILRTLEGVSEITRIIDQESTLEE